MPRPSLEVRRAGPDDVEDLQRLWLEAREEVVPLGRSMLLGTPAAVRERMVQLLAAHDTSIFVATSEGTPAGFVITRTGRLTPMCDTLVAEVDHVFVTRDMRRRGIGRALLAGVAAAAERCGADQVVCNASPLARDTQRFLARLGFSPLVTLRAAPTGTLVRKLAGESRRGALEDLISRRRRLRARGAVAAVPTPVEPPVEPPVPAEVPVDVPVAPIPPPTLELPVVSEDAAAPLAVPGTPGQPAPA